MTTIATRPVFAAGIIAAFAGLVWAIVPAEAPVRFTLAIFGATVILWIATRYDRTAIGLGAALLLVLVGVLPARNLYATLGQSLIWLLIGAFIIASVLTEIRLAERLARLVLRPARNVSRLFYGMTWLIAGTAFMIPSTTGRAAFLLPVFLTLASSIANRAVTRAMSVHIPVIILLSAAGSLIGAGAHLVAVDLMRDTDGTTIGFAQWVMLALPFALAMCMAATFVVLRLFLSPEDRALRLDNLADLEAPPLGGREKFILAIVAITIGMWLTHLLHGIDVAIVTLVAALVVMLASPSGKSIKESVLAIDWNLILFVAAASAIGEALVVANVAGAVTDGLTNGTALSATHPAVVVAFIAVIASLGHLLITSRTARAVALIPLLAFPAAAFGYETKALIFLTVIATGYCLTLTVSAKSLIVYSGASTDSFSHADLLRLSSVLFPLHLVLIVIFALYVWPWLGLPLQIAPTAGAS